MTDDAEGKALPGRRIHFIVYEVDTGRIRRAGSVSNPADVEMQAKKDRGEAAAVTEGKVDGRRFYVDNGGVAKRPELAVPEAIDVPVGEAVNLDLPNGTRIRRGSVDVGAVAGPAAFVPETAGVTVLRCEPPFPYRRRTVRVTAGRDEMVARAKAGGEAARRSFAGLG